MDYVPFVEIVHSLKSLGEEPESLGFSEGGFCVLVVEEVTAFRVLHNHVDAVSF